MRYVALLRGINVGGGNKVEMKQLKATFEGVGFTNVRTWINSGNVIFDTGEADRAALTARVEASIEARFALQVPVLLRSAEEMRAMVDAIPASWVNDDSMKCDVLFLWPEVDAPSIVEKLDLDPAIDDLIYVPGAAIRRADKPDSAKTRLTRILGTPLYKQMTMRNVNTARKLAAMLEE